MSDCCSLYMIYDRIIDTSSLFTVPAVSLSTIVLNSRDWWEIIGSGKFHTLKINLAIGLHDI